MSATSFSPAEQVVLPLAHADAERIVAMDAAGEAPSRYRQAHRASPLRQGETLDEAEFFGDREPAEGAA